MDLFQVVAIVVSLALTVVAVVLVTQATRSIVGVIRTGQPSITRSENPVGRTLTMAKETMLHTRMLQWTVVGVMHWFIYFAFIVLGAAVFTAYFQLFDPEFQLPVVGHFFLYEWLGEFLGVLGSIGIVYLIYYRQKHHPRSEGRNSRFYRSTMWQAYFVEAMVLIEGSAILFIRGAEYNLGRLGDEPELYSRFHFPVSSFFGDVLFPSGAGSADSLETIIIAIAMIKIVLAMIWLVVIARNLTMGVAWHRFTAWFNIWFKREPSGRTALGAMKPLTSGGKAVTLDDVEDLDEDSKLGVGALEDFSWKAILDFTTCTECGRCQSQCPAWNTEKPLNPKLLITALRDATYARAPYTQAVQAGGEEAGAALLEGNDTLTREVARPLIGDVPEGEWFYNPDSGAAVIDPEVLWNCTSCGACVQQCPVDIEHVDHIMDMRRHAVLVESNFPAQLNGLFKGLENKGNPWNMSPNARMDWAKGLDFEVKVVGESIESLDEVDWLFWVGCAGAYEDRAKKTTRAVAELLELAGISFGVLGNGETCTGDPARRAGNEFVFQGLAQQNVEVLTEAKAKKVVSTCAHCFNTLKNEYSDFGIELEVIHHTQLLNRLVREGKLTPVQDGAGAHKRSITYHDPCYIGRHNGVYTPPRELLQVLPGAEFVEMERNSERSFCCGAGGARMWMEENIGSRINVNRTVEAVSTGADQIAVGCPFCRVMLSDGLTAQQAKGEAREEVEILDVAQMLLASVKGEMATKLAPSRELVGAGAPAAAATATATAAPTAPAKAAGPPAPGDDQDGPDHSTDSDGPDVPDDELGPVAKAAGGGTSLFGEPSPAETAQAGASPADEAAAAKAAPSGGSLFDTPAPAAPAAPAPTSGGSLFDTPAPAAAEPAPAEPASTPAPAAAPADGLGSGSLFDLGDAPAAPATPAAPASTPAPAAEPAGTEPGSSQQQTSEAAPAPVPATDLGSGSLFDIAPAEAPAPAKAPAPAPTAPESAAPEAEPEAPAASAAPAGDPEPQPAAPEPAASGTSGTASTPATSIPEGGSLFDLEAPAAVAVAAPTQAAPTQTAAPEPDAAAPDAAAAPEPQAEPEPEPQPEAVTTPVTAGSTGSTGSARKGGSLFSFAAPRPTAPAGPAAPSAPAAQASTPESTPPAAAATPAEAPAEAPAASTPEPAAPAAGLTGGAAVSAAATAAASDDGPAPEAEDPVAPPAEATATQEETAADTAPEPEVASAEETADQSAPVADAPVPATGSGEAHQPKTDVDISGSSSLFDL